MEKQITIIIPTYNMENYIGKCLDSLLIPELDKVEVLVVNDGSKDRSSEIAHGYADRFPDSIKVIDKPNGNYGSCINAALPQVTGRYVKVLDADDTFDNDSFSKLVEALPGIDADIVITTHRIVDGEGRESGRSFFAETMPLNRSLSLKDNANFVPDYVQMHRLAYRYDVFARFPYKQTEGISYTDSQWSVVPFAYCQNFMCIDLPVYRYLIGREGQTMYGKEMMKFMSNFFTALSDTCDYLKSYKQEYGNYDLLLKHILDVHEFVYFKVLAIPTSEAMNALKCYDTKLKSKNLDLYHAIGEISWTSEVPFKVFNDIRRKSYPENYRVPFVKRLKLSLNVKLKSLFK